MPRKRKRLDVIKRPTRNVAIIDARRSIIWELMLRGGSDNSTILATLRNHEPPFDVSVDTIMDDKKFLDAEAEQHFASERKSLASRYLSKLERLHREQERLAAELPPGSRSLILSAIGTTIMNQAKLSGVLVDKQEVSGRVTNVNLNGDLTPEEKLKAVKLALRNARIDEDGNPLR